MKLAVIILLLSLSVINNSDGQICIPDTTYLSDSMIISPSPYRDDLPGSGITKKACINTPYDLIFSVKVPDKISVPLLGEISINYVQLLSIDGLPTGLTYTCRSTDCKMYKNTYDCMNISGTPTSANAPGTYPIKINFKINTVALGDINYSFPDPNLARGTYELQLLAEGSSECNAAIHSSSRPLFDIWVNERNAQIDLALISDAHIENAQLMIFNNEAVKIIVDQIKIQPGNNTWSYNKNNCPPGIYYYLINTEKGIQSGKFFISK